MNSYIYIAAALGTLATGPRVAGQDNPFRKTLSDVATRAAREALAEKQVKFESPSVAGTIQAVDPEKTLQVEIKDFNLRNDQATVKLTVSLDYRLTGKPKSDASGQELSARLAIILGVDGNVLLSNRNGKYFIKPKVTDLSIVDVKIHEVKPSNLVKLNEKLPDGKRPVGG